MTGYARAAASLLWVGAVLLWVGAVFCALHQTVFASSAARMAAWAAVLFGVLTLGLGTALNLADRQTAAGPCLRYETGTQYNPATKTVMPYRRCAERGEWLTEDTE